MGPKIPNPEDCNKDTLVTTYLCFIPSLSSFFRGKVPKTEDLALVLIERLVPWPGEDCGKVCALLLGDRQKEEREMLVKRKTGVSSRTETKRFVSARNAI
jgi:hypothetical protein